ncbi:MAG: UbiA-like polyprenyltransferase [Nitrospinota bacterium]
MSQSIGMILKDVKIQHTIFALPFAIASAVVAADGIPSLRSLLLLLMAMIFARSAAMAFNRLVDMNFDRLNPRTKDRPLARGFVHQNFYRGFIVVNSAAFVVVAFHVGKLAFTLAPVALFLIFLYSLTKRFTSYSHFFLGAALSLAPLGGWIVVRGTIELAPMILAVAVLFWLAGLDIIYACQDCDFDRSIDNIYSLPKKVGITTALRFAALCHLVMIVILAIFGLYVGMSFLYWIGLIFIGILLSYEHSLVSEEDLSQVNKAFFNVNGYISLLFALFVIADKTFLNLL